MNDNQLNCLNMAKTAMGVMHSNNSIWGSNTKITALYQAIEQCIKDITELEETQSDSTKGATISEHDAWIIAANYAEHVCFGLKAYYDDLDDAINFEKINYTITDFQYGQRDEVLDRMKKVYKMASGITIGDLADFNVVALDLTNLDGAITDFDNSIPVRNVLRTVTSAATQELIPLFATLRKKLKKLDNFIGGFKQSHVAFYDAYKKSRAIINLGKTQVAEELHLMPHEFKAIFGKKLKIGNWVTVRNHSDFPATVYLTDDTNTLLVKNEVIIPANDELKLAVPADFKNEFKHNLMIYNQNTLDDVQITVILSKTKSQSQAGELPKKG
jgi:hypothetical protein